MKDELRHVISGKSQVRHGTTIQATASFLKRSSGTSKMVKSQKHYKKQETESLKIFITQNKLWIEGVDIAQYISEGAEQKVYLSDDNYVLKLNDGIFYTSWEDYLNNLLLHNFFFPDTAYELLGFIINSDVLFAVVKQRFVKATAQTDLQLLKDFLASNGFINSRNNDYYHPQLGIILEDLHDENVLTKDGVLHFIDTVFYIQNEFYKD
jgi:hypothetical protein